MSCQSYTTNRKLGADGDSLGHDDYVHSDWVSEVSYGKGVCIWNLKYILSSLLSSISTEIKEGMF